MRSKVELLKLLRKELHGDRFHTGLCSLNLSMLNFQIIRESECRKLEYLIDTNRPKENFWIYYFPKGEIEPRDKFLKQLIEKYENSKATT